MKEKKEIEVPAEEKTEEAKPESPKDAKPEAGLG